MNALDTPGSGGHHSPVSNTEPSAEGRRSFASFDLPAPVVEGIEAGDGSGHGGAIYSRGRSPTTRGAP